jgi:hypothetical protein
MAPKQYFENDAKTKKVIGNIFGNPGCHSEQEIPATTE